MSRSDAVTLSIVALCAIVPFAVVVLAALIRGYTINLSMRRPGRHWRRDDDDA